MCLLPALLATASLAAPVPRDGAADAAARFAARLRADAVPRPPRAGETAVYLLDLDGNAPAILAACGGDAKWENVHCGSPVWTRDGRGFYFDATPGHGNWEQTRIESVALGAGGIERAPRGPGNCPSPSPDGAQLARLLNISIGGGDTGIYASGAAGGELRPLGVYGIPRWAPAGSDVLVAQFGHPTTLELVDAATRERRAVELAGHQFNVPAHWAGERRLVAGTTSPQGTAIRLVDVSDPGAATVTETLWAKGDGLPADVNIAGAVYHPASKRGAFVGRTPDGGCRLYSLEPGKKPRELEPGRAAGKKLASPALSPDGRFLLFCDVKRD